MISQALSEASPHTIPQLLPDHTLLMIPDHIPEHTPHHTPQPTPESPAIQVDIEFLVVIYNMKLLHKPCSISPSKTVFFAKERIQYLLCCSVQFQLKKLSS